MQPRACPELVEGAQALGNRRERNQPRRGERSISPLRLKANDERPTTNDAGIHLGAQFMPLSLTLSRFCLQLISFQRFCPSSPANLVIPEDHGGRVYRFITVAGGELVLL